MEIYNEIALAPWGYENEPPYQVVATTVPDYTLISWHEFRALSKAMAWFVRFQVGPMEERAAGVVDGNRQLIVGYRALPDTEPEWIGTAAGFVELAKHHPPVIVLGWELQARDNGKPPHVPQDVVK